MNTDTTKTLTINLAHNRKISLPVRHDGQSNKWVIEIPDETFKDITGYANSNWYSFDESSSIRIE